LIVQFIKRAFVLVRVHCAQPWRALEQAL